MTSGRIRVLHVITRLVVGGAQENTLLTVRHLDRHRYDLTLASGPSHGPEGTVVNEIPHDVPFVQIPELVRFPNPVKDAAVLYRLYRLMRRENYTIVHTHTTKAGMLGRTAARLAGVPIVIHTPHGHAFHDYLGPAASAVLTLVERAMAGWTNRIVCLTEAERQDHIRMRIGPPEKFEVIHSGVDLERFRNVTVDTAAKRRELGLPPSGPLVGCVARLVPVKGVQYLLEAVPGIRRGSEATVVFVGDGPLRPTLERRAATLGLDGAVAFLGLRRDVDQIMPLFDVTVLPSLNEGMGKAAVEAMAAGSIVVGSRVSGIQDVIQHERNGLLFPPGDPPAIAAAVLRCLSDRALAFGLRASAQTSVGRFAIVPMVERIDALYQREQHLRQAPQESGIPR